MSRRSKRDSIISAALRELERTGDIRISRFAEACGIPRSTIYNNFPGGCDEIKAAAHELAFESLRSLISEAEWALWASTNESEEPRVVRQNTSRDFVETYLYEIAQCSARHGEFLMEILAGDDPRAETERKRLAAAVEEEKARGIFAGVPTAWVVKALILTGRLVAQDKPKQGHHRRADDLSPGDAYDVFFNGMKYPRLDRN